MKEYYVYIMSSERGTLYAGITNNLEQRVYQHKKKLIDGFTKKYNITQLVYFESTDDVTSAIAREKQIKRMLRSKKIDLIRTMNPQWQDLSEGWFDNDVNNISSPPPDSSSPDRWCRGFIGGLQNDNMWSSVIPDPTWNPEKYPPVMC